MTEVDERNKCGRFRYGKSYLSRSNAFPLDPIHLPLNDQEHQINFNKGVFGVLSDAGADSWGERVILSLHATKPKNRIEFLLAGSGMGVVFSLSSHALRELHSASSTALLIFAGRITTCCKLADYFGKQRQRFFPVFEHTFNC